MSETEQQSADHPAADSSDDTGRASTIAKNGGTSSRRGKKVQGAHQAGGEGGSNPADRTGLGEAPPPDQKPAAPAQGAKNDHIDASDGRARTKTTSAKGVYDLDNTSARELIEQMMRDDPEAEVAVLLSPIKILTVRALHAWFADNQVRDPSIPGEDTPNPVPGKDAIALRVVQHRPSKRGKETTKDASE